jgi:hypothetical protein
MCCNPAIEGVDFEGGWLIKSITKDEACQLIRTKVQQQQKMNSHHFFLSRCRCPAHSQAFSGHHHPLPAAAANTSSSSRCVSGSQAIPPPSAKEYAFEVNTTDKT